MENIKFGIFVDSNKIPSTPEYVSWAICGTLSDFKSLLTKECEVVSISSHLNDGSSSTELLSFIADKYLSGELNKKLKVKCHSTNAQHIQFVSRRWREIKQELKEWDL